MAWGWWKPSDVIPPVALAVCPTEAGGSHVGIVYQTEDSNSQPALLHLAFHCHLVVEPNFVPATSAYFILLPNLPRAVAEAVAARCRSIARHQPEVKYGFAMQLDAYFDSDGHLFTKGERGLNCSTFVLTVFRSAGVRLVDESTWPVGRSGDREQYEMLLDTLRTYIERKYVGAADQLARHREFVAKIAPDVSSTRVRPEETAGAALSEKLPVEFTRGALFGREVYARLYPTTIRGDEAVLPVG